MKVRIPATAEGISAGLDIIEQVLTHYRLNEKDVRKKMLVAEEVMTALLSHAENAKTMHLSIPRLFEDITIEIAVTGKDFPFESNLAFGVDLDTDEIGYDAEQTIRNTILRSVVDDLKYRHRNGVNSVRITVTRSERAMLYKTLGAMALAIVLGILLRLLAPEAFRTVLNNNLLVPVKTMFMNALKMIVTPVVFFSIVSCIGQFSDLSEVGKVGGKVIALYLVTTLIAIGLGVGMFFLFRPGSPTASVLAADGSAAVAQELDFALKDMIVNIMPSNFFKPFLEADMLQPIFLAVLCGIAVGMIGQYSQMLSQLFTACNELFLKITMLLVQFMPLAAFCSINGHGSACIPFEHPCRFCSGACRDDGALLPADAPAVPAESHSILQKTCTYDGAGIQHGFQQCITSSEH